MQTIIGKWGAKKAQKNQQTLMIPQFDSFRWIIRSRILLRISSDMILVIPLVKSGLGPNEVDGRPIRPINALNPRSGLINLPKSSGFLHHKILSPSS